MTTPTGWQTQGWAPPPPPRGQVTEPLSVWSLVLGILGLTFCLGVGGIAALITGARAKSAIDKSEGRKKGRSMAVAGQALGGLGIAGGVLVVVLFSLAAVFVGHRLKYTTLHQGDCFDRNTGMFSHLVTRHACTRPHQYEVVGTFDGPAGRWPGPAGIAAAADPTCQGFARQYGVSPRPDLQLVWIYPSAGTWSHGTRTIVCSLRNSDGTKRTGSLRGSGTVTTA